MTPILPPEMAFRRDHLSALRYSSPFVLATCAIALSIAIACFVPPSKRTTLKPSQRRVSRRCAAVLCLLHFCEGLLQAFRAIVDPDAAVEQDAVCYTTLCFLLWLVIYLIQADARRVYWLPNLTTWILALLLEAIVSLSSFRKTHVGLYEFFQLAVGLVRVASLVFLCISTVVRTAKPLPRDSEREPLLGSLHEGPVGYLSEPLRDDKQDEYENNCTPAELEQEKQVEQCGGWWAYLHEVQFLLPYIIPIKNRRRQLYSLAMLVLMIGGRVSQLVGPRLLGNIVQAISNNHPDGTLFRQILIYIFAIKLPYDVAIEPARKWLSIRLFYGSYQELLLSLASHVSGLSYAWHENKQTGEIIAAIGQGQVLNQFVDEFVESTLPLVLDILAAFAYITYLFDVYVALILACTYVIYGVVTYRGTILCAEARRKYRETSRVECDVLYEAIANWMSTFYLNRREYQHQRLKSLGSRELEEHKYDYDVNLIMRTCQSMVIGLGYLGILLRTSHLTTHGENAVGNFVALLFYWSFFTNPLFKLAAFYTSVVQVLVDVERLRQLMHTKPTVLDLENAHDLVYREGAVEYRDVSFSYDGKNKVIKDLSLTIAPGSTVAFVGESGSGKTTTCDKLLFRAYDVDEGSILIDGQNIRSVRQKSLRDTVGIVRQEPVFNNDTVMENVRYARLDATDAEVVAACRDAAIHDQIMRFPMGYHTIIGERGVKLSGGERQRLAIAQLFLRDPKIVVLDEATSSIDNVLESEIQESFARLCKNRTTIIIAHRLSTVQHADQIVVLKNGSIAECGTHDQLLAKRGKYYQLWNKTQTVKRLKKDLHQIELGPLGEQTSFSPQAMLSDSDHDDDDDDLPDILQVDGASSSKQGNETRTGMRRRLRSLREKLHSGKAKAGANDSECTDTDEEEDNASPMRLLSPRAITTSDSPSPPRRPSTSHNKTSLIQNLSNVSPPASPTRIDPRTISSPLPPVHTPTHELKPQFNAEDPIPSSPLTPQMPLLRTLSQTPRPTAVRHVSTPSRIPVRVSPFTTPVRAEERTAREILLMEPRSPGRDDALGSHPVRRGEGEEEEEEFGVAKKGGSGAG